MRQVFNGDTSLQSKFEEIVNEYKPDLILETGTFHGETTEFFAKFGVTVYTTEINYENALTAHNVLKDFKNVRQLIGDSVNCLNKIKENLVDKKILCFLDSHWNNDKVLERELDFFTENNIKPYILIHDFYNPEHPEYGYDVWDNHRYDYNFYKSYFDKVYGENQYSYYYNKDAVGAKRGVIFLHPK